MKVYYCITIPTKKDYEKSIIYRQLHDAPRATGKKLEILKKSTFTVLFLYEKAANASDRKQKAARTYVLKIGDFQHDC